MSSHEKIVCAVDGSEDAFQVVEVAKRVAESSGAQLTLMTAIKPIAQVYGGLDLAVLAHNGVSFEEEAITKAREWLDKLDADYDLSGGDRVCEKVAVIGAPANEVRAYAATTQADLIVMGSHGRHGFSRVMGSTANGVLHGVPCDVLVVRIREEDPS